MANVTGVVRGLQHQGGFLAQAIRPRQPKPICVNGGAYNRRVACAMRNMVANAYTSDLLAASSNGPAFAKGDQSRDMRNEVSERAGEGP